MTAVDRFTPEIIKEMIQALAQQLQEKYVFPQVGKQASEALLQHLANGQYDLLATGQELADFLTTHLQELTQDKHVRLRYRAEQLPHFNRANESADMMELRRHQGLRTNFGLYRVERLAGNVGYLDLRNFALPEWVADTIVAVMNFLAHTDALIIDIRQNRGGYTSMMSLLASYFLAPTPILLMNLYDRAGQCVRETWSYADLPSKRYGTEKPVYVLTSACTFSAAEAFAHTLQSLKRVVIVGEQTGGGANNVDLYRLDNHFAVNLPSWQSISAISQTNWEGTGVIPDRVTSAERALHIAHLEALQAISAQLQGKHEIPFELQKEIRDTLRILSTEH